MRFVGDPMKRIEEDVLRLLRFFRFFAHYGRPPMDPAALAACRRMAPELVKLSGERVAGELVRLLQAPDPASVLIVMHGEGILRPILPEASEFGRLRVMTWLETRALVRPHLHPDPIRRLAVILHADAEGVDAIGERLKLSGVQTDRLRAMVAPKVAVARTMDERAARRALRRVGADVFRDLVLCAWAAERAAEARMSTAETAAWIRLLDLADAWQPVQLPVRGADALALGVPRGPAIGAVLAQVDEWWEVNDFRPGRDQCLEKLRMVAGAAS
ncbi:MAG: hypothetical protein NVV74_25495 [Magnetospirillum sp.]|nr:hypothetical protein [Magnetospirillum sp.]